MSRRRYLMLRNTPSLADRLARMFGVVCIVAGLVLAATSAAAEPGFTGTDEPRGRVFTVSSFEAGGRSFVVTASGRRAYADTQMMRARVEEARDLRNALPGYPQEPRVKVDMRMAF